MKRNLKTLQGIHTTGCSFVIKCSFRTCSSAAKCIMLWETRRSQPELQPKQQQRRRRWVMKHSLLHFTRSESISKVVLKDSHQQNSMAACKYAAYAGYEPPLGLWTLATSGGKKLPGEIWLLGPTQALSGDWKTIVRQIGWWSQSSTWWMSECPYLP